MTQVSLLTLVAGARSGQIVSFPTDTVPALAVLPERSELIFEIKIRSQEKPLILMGASAQSLWPFVTASPQERQIFEQVAAQFWPGALTLVLPASENVPQAIYGRGGTTPTIGLRVPNHALAQKILSQTGSLATTSANRSGNPPLLTIAEIEAEFPDVLTLNPTELEAMAPSLSVPSTVARWSGNGWEILRQGEVKL